MDICEPLPNHQDLADGVSILFAKTVKGVQRQFRNKTKAVLKPLFKAGVWN